MVKKKTRVIAIIPARGGSKSIPRKNIKRLGGFPLIAYSIAAARNTKSVDRVIVTTDDDEIAGIAKKFGAEVPFKRPPQLADDTARDLPVFQHALDWLAKNERSHPEIIVQLRPTSPLRPPGCVERAVNLILKTPDTDSIRSVTHAGQNPYKMWRIVNGQLESLLQTAFHEPYNMPRQELPSTYWQTGHIDVIRTRVIRAKKSMSGDIILPYFVDTPYVLDLDTPEQWEYAEYVLRRKNLDIVRPVQPHSLSLDRIKLFVSDFDGVMTDNTVYLSQDGKETVACSREDGMGLSLLQKKGIPFVVLSTEKNPVVARRCEKLCIPCYQGISEKSKALSEIASEYRVGFQEILFLGNDINDLKALRKAGIAVAPADAHPQVLAEASIVLQKKGGKGAVRELCDLILNTKGA